MDADKAFKGKIFCKKLRKALFPAADPVNKVIAGNAFHGWYMQVCRSAVKDHKIIHFQFECENLSAFPAFPFCKIFIKGDLFIKIIFRHDPHVPGFQTSDSQSGKFQYFPIVEFMQILFFYAQCPHDITCRF